MSSALEEEELLAQYETLEEGDTGDAVLALQQRLEELGYLTEEYDGHYGATTADCVSRFQEANGLTADRVASPETQLALFRQGACGRTAPPCRMRRSLPPDAVLLREQLQRGFRKFRLGELFQQCRVLPGQFFLF